MGSELGIHKIVGARETASKTRWKRTDFQKPPSALHTHVLIVPRHTHTEGDPERVREKQRMEEKFLSVEKVFHLTVGVTQNRMHVGRFSS